VGGQDSGAQGCTESVAAALLDHSNEEVYQLVLLKKTTVSQNLLQYTIHCIGKGIIVRLDRKEAINCCFIQEETPDALLSQDVLLDTVQILRGNLGSDCVQTSPDASQN
jgi:hypothetical protein